MKVNSFKILVTFNSIFFVAIIFQAFLMAINDNIFRSLDEIFIISTLSISIFYAFRYKDSLNYLFHLLFFYLYIVFISILFGFNKNLYPVLMQSFIHLKFFILFAFFYTLYLLSIENVRRETYLYKKLHLMVNLVFIVSVIGFLLNLALAEKFYQFFNVDFNVRAGGIRIYGFQLKPNDIAFFFSFYCLYRYLYSYFKFDKKFTIIFISCLLMIIANGSRVALILPFAIIFHYCWSNKKLLILMLPTSILLFPYILTLEYFNFVIDETAQNINEFSDIEHSQYIRAIMLYFGFDLATSYFPLGTGVATFGSVMAGNSTVYNMLGIGNLRFFQEGIGIYDSNLATILGELGTIGLVMFSSFLIYIFKYYFKRIHLGSDILFLILSIAFFVVILIFTNPFFMYQYNSTVFHIFILLIVLKLRRPLA